MQDIKFRTNIFLALILLVSYFVSKIFSLTIAIVFLVLSLTIYLISHLFWINELSKWLDKPKTRDSGWKKVFGKKYFQKYIKTIGSEQKNKKFTTAMEQFVQAADALLDGVVSLNESNEIIWCNKRAQLMFGINRFKDINKPIHISLGILEFKKYLEKKILTYLFKLISKNSIIMSK